ncbi:hypothetical protein E2C01_069860 [Portunus trituberculatus]|uniref:Uncharacterized protein n=1 Tax=Portunus trituberculatus TaxID=210409 RepID=A0A5B7HVP1_PORTR|nr:hypothetical protein [Portunus trituberculatus]
MSTSRPRSATRRHLNWSLTMRATEATWPSLRRNCRRNHSLLRGTHLVALVCWRIVMVVGVWWACGEG